MKYSALEHDAMVRGFAEALLFTTSHTNEEGITLHEELRGFEFFVQSMESIKTACHDFLKNLPEHIGEAARVAYSGRPWGAFDCIGHDFLLTRNGHGAGFWDRDWLPDGLGDALTEYTKNWGECYATLGDDDAVYTDNVAVRSATLTLPEWSAPE